MIPFQLERICTIMQPQKGNELETEGVLNPAATRGPDGELYLFPRLVAKNNYSRIGIAKVKFDDNGEPIGVERLGIALQPEADYEKRPNGGGGCEDARVTFVDPLDYYIMTYTAYGPNGSRIAMAKSKDLLKWERLGLVKYLPYKGIDFNGIYNKDASVFPYTIISPNGHPSIGMLHRPLFPGSTPEETVKDIKNRIIDSHKESIWISYYNFGEDTDFEYAKFTSNHRMAIPIELWENLKIGAGSPPLLTKLGWLIIYHGVHELADSTPAKPKLCYSAGVMILSIDDPQKVIYRSPKPILFPELPAETIGTIANVVFPTGVDCRNDIDQPNRIDVYYGMADNKIGVAKMIIPDVLPDY